MIPRETSLLLLTTCLLLGSVRSQGERAYDTSDWIPITPSSPIQSSASEIVEQKVASDRVLSLESPGQKYFPDDQQYRRPNQVQQFTGTPKNKPFDHPRPRKLKHPLDYKYEVPQPNVNYYNGEHLVPFSEPTRPKYYEISQKYMSVPSVNPQAPSVDAQSIYEQYQLPFNNTFYQSLNPAAINNDFYQAVNKKPPATVERENVQLVYVPVENLPKAPQAEQLVYTTPQYNSVPERVVPEEKLQVDQKQARLQTIQQDFLQQALQAHKLQEQFRDDINPIQQEIISTTTAKPKKKPHQPPLAVFLESNSKAEIADVLDILKDAKSISVQDSISQNSPEIFIGPSNLDSPEGYTKFPLPYLNNVNGNRIERKIDQLPFFVAPVSYKAPPGYAKISLPSPHVGSVVVSIPTAAPPSSTPDPQLFNPYGFSTPQGYEFIDQNGNVYQSTGAPQLGQEENSYSTRQPNAQENNYIGRQPQENSYSARQPVQLAQQIQENSYNARQPNQLVQENSYNSRQPQQPQENKYSARQPVQLQQQTQEISRPHETSFNSRQSNQLAQENSYSTRQPQQPQENKYSVRQPVQPPQQIQENSFNARQSNQLAQENSYNTRQPQENIYSSTRQPDLYYVQQPQIPKQEPVRSTTQLPNVNPLELAINEFELHQINDQTEEHNKVKHSTTRRPATTTAPSRGRLNYENEQAPSRGRVRGRGRPTTTTTTTPISADPDRYTVLEEFVARKPSTESYQDTEAPRRSTPGFRGNPYLPEEVFDVERRPDNVQYEAPAIRPQANVQIESANVYNLNENFNRPGQTYTKLVDEEVVTEAPEFEPQQVHRFGGPEVVSYENREPVRHQPSEEPTQHLTEVQPTEEPQDSKSAILENLFQPNFDQTYISLQDQAVRSLLVPNLLAPSSKEQDQPRDSEINQSSYSTEAPTLEPSTTEPSTTTTKASRGRARGRTRLSTTSTSAPRRASGRRRPVASSRTTTTPSTDYYRPRTNEITDRISTTENDVRYVGDQEAPQSFIQFEDQQVVTVGPAVETPSALEYENTRVVPEYESSREQLQQEYETRRPLVPAYQSSREQQQEYETRRPQVPAYETSREQQQEYETRRPQVPAYETSREQQQEYETRRPLVSEYESPRVQARPAVAEYDQPRIQARPAPTTEAPTKSNEEENFIRHNANIKSAGVINNRKSETTTVRARGRTRGRSRFATSTTTSRPVTRIATRPAATRVITTEEPESYGFTRQPSYTPTNLNIQAKTQFVGEIRPKYSRTTTTVAPEEVDTPRARVRARTRAPSKKPASSTNSQDQVTRRSSTSPIARTRGRTHYRPQENAKRASEDEDVASQNYPVNFLQKLESSSPRSKQQFRVTVDPLEGDDQSPYSSLYSPKFVPRPNSLPTEDKVDKMEALAISQTTTEGSSETTEREISEVMEEMEKIQTDQSEKKKSRRRGAWKLVRAKPVDPLEVSESQNYQTVLNAFDTIEKVDAYDKSTVNKEDKRVDFREEEEESTVLSDDFEDLTVPSTINTEANTEVVSTSTTTEETHFFDSIYEMFGVFKHENASTEAPATTTIVATPTFPEEITEQGSTDSTTLLEVKSSTKPYEVEPWEMREVKTSTSTEVSHETEICYKGRCVKSKDKKKLIK